MLIQLLVFVVFIIPFSIFLIFLLLVIVVYSSSSSVSMIFDCDFLIIHSYSCGWFVSLLFCNYYSLFPSISFSLPILLMYKYGRSQSSSLSCCKRHSCSRTSICSCTRLCCLRPCPHPRHHHHILSSLFFMLSLSS